MGKNRAVGAVFIKQSAMNVSASGGCVLQGPP